MAELSVEYLTDTPNEVWMLNAPATFTGLVNLVELTYLDLYPLYLDGTFGAVACGNINMISDTTLNLATDTFTVCFWANLEGDAYGNGPGMIVINLEDAFNGSLLEINLQDGFPPWVSMTTSNDYVGDGAASEVTGWAFYAIRWDGTDLVMKVNDVDVITLTPTETNTWAATQLNVIVNLMSSPPPPMEATPTGSTFYAMAIFEDAISDARLTAYYGATIDPVLTIPDPVVYGSVSFIETGGRTMFGGASTVNAVFRAVEIGSSLSINPDYTAVIPNDDYTTWPGFSVVITTTSGSTVGTINDVQIGEVNETMNNESDGFTFNVPVTNSIINSINEPYHEATLFRGGLLAQGVIQSRRLSERGGMVEFTVTGVRWYLSQRTVSRFPRVEKFTNGSFNNGLAPWQPQAAPAQGQHVPPSASITGEKWGSDSTSLLLTNSGKGNWIGYDPDPEPTGKDVFEGNDGFVYQHFAWIIPWERSEGDVFTLTAWCKVPSEGYTHPPYEERGLWIELFSDLNLPADKPTIRTKSLQYAFVPINDSTPKDTWLRMQVSMTVPMAQKAEADGSYTKMEYQQTVSARLYCPTGSVFWNGASMTWNERLKFKDAPLSTILAKVIEVCQRTDLGKDSLRLSAGGSGGRKTDVTYLYSNRENVGDIFNDFLTTGGGIEARVIPSLSGTRSIQLGSRIGSYIGHLSLTDDNALVDVSFETNGSEVENQITVQADTSTRKEDNTTSGDGSYNDQARDEGTADGGGPVLEGLHTAIQGSHPTSLPGQAARLKAFYGSKSTMVTTTIADPMHYYWRTVKPGDTISVNLSNGSFSALGVYRVMSKALSPNGTTSFTVLDLAHAYNPL